MLERMGPVPHPARFRRGALVDRRSTSSVERTSVWAPPPLPLTCSSRSSPTAEWLSGGEGDQADEGGGGGERWLADLDAALEQRPEGHERDQHRPAVGDDLAGDDDGGAGD